MQRITWTGIAMHGGVLPGHPASYGCVRLPIDFSSRLFDLNVRQRQPPVFNNWGGPYGGWDNSPYGGGFYCSQSKSRMPALVQRK